MTPPNVVLMTLNQRMAVMVLLLPALAPEGMRLVLDAVEGLAVLESECNIVVRIFLFHL